MVLWCRKWFLIGCKVSEQLLPLFFTYNGTLAAAQLHSVTSLTSCIQMRTGEMKGADLMEKLRTRYHLVDSTSVWTASLDTEARELQSSGGSTVVLRTEASPPSTTNTSLPDCLTKLTINLLLWWNL